MIETPHLALIICALAFVFYCAIKNARRMRARGFKPDPADYLVGGVSGACMAGVAFLFTVYFAQRLFV